MKYVFFPKAFAQGGEGAGPSGRSPMGRGPGHRHRHGFRGRFGGRARRGDVKYEILAVLKEGPRHGYEVMLAIEERRGGLRPSPGSIYPALQMLEDEEYVTSSEVGGKRVYALTDKGRELLERQTQARADAGLGEDGDEADLTMVRGWKAIRGLATSAKEIARSGNPEAIKKAVDVLDRARKELFQILADDL